MEINKFDNITKGINLKAHMIKYEVISKSLWLYDLKGVLLDQKKIGFLINDICIIDDNYILISVHFNILMKIKIINNTLEIVDKLYINKCIYDFIYIKETKLLIISFEKIIGIWDIDTLHKNPIQIINNNSHYLFNFNSNIFISSDNNSISVYQKTNNIKLYQLSNILTLDNKYSWNKLNLVGLDDRILMIAHKNKIYLIDIRNMITKKKFKFINGYIEIKSLYKKGKDIYLNIRNFLYTFRYNKSNLEIISIIKKQELKNNFCPFFKGPTKKLRMKDILNNNESIKFSSFENENSFGLFLTPEPRIFIDFLINLINIYLSNLIDDQTNRVQARNNYNQINFVGEEIQSPLLDRRNYGLSAKSKTRSLMQNERGNEIRNSKKNHIINPRNNYDKRKKFKIINKKKIKNNPITFKKKYR
jgi:hypothetical protein